MLFSMCMVCMYFTRAVLKFIAGSYMPLEARSGRRRAPQLQVSPMGDAITYEPFGSTSTLAEGRLCAPAGGVPSASAATQLILSTHQALMSFTPADGCFNVLSRGRGHYQSVLPARLVLSGRARAEDEEEEEELLLVGSQRIDAAPARTQPLPDADLLLLVNGRTRRTLGSYRLPTEYLHDSILDGETGDVLAVDSSRGEVLLLSMLPLPPRATAGAAAGAANHTGRWRLEVAGGVPGLSVRRRYPVAGAAAHINSVALGRGCVSTVAVLVAPQLTAPASWVDSPRLLPVPCAWGELLNHSGPSGRVWSHRCGLLVGTGKQPAADERGARIQRAYGARGGSVAARRRQLPQPALARGWLALPDEPEGRRHAAG